MSEYIMSICRLCFFFFSSRRRHTRFDCDWSSDVCSSDLGRRVVLAFSDGVDEPMDFSGHAKSLKDEMKRAEDSDIMVYAIGMEGLAPMQRSEERRVGKEGRSRWSPYH